MSIFGVIKSRPKTSVGVGVLASLLAIVVIFAVTYKVAPVSSGWWGPINESSGLALKGHDPVVYHTEGAAKPGLASITHRWKDITWQFASNGNRSLFVANPARYAPRYGGFCATAISAGFTADIKPKQWHVHDGKLYLFADADPKEDWIAALDDGVIDRGNENWAGRRYQ